MTDDPALHIPPRIKSRGHCWPRHFEQSLRGLMKRSCASVGELGREDEALVAQLGMSADAAVGCADVGIPVAEIERELVDREAQADVPVDVDVVAVDAVDEITVSTV